MTESHNQRLRQGIARLREEIAELPDGHLVVEVPTSLLKDVLRDSERTTALLDRACLLLVDALTCDQSIDWRNAANAVIADNEAPR